MGSNPTARADEKEMTDKQFLYNHKKVVAVFLLAVFFVLGWLANGSLTQPNKSKKSGTYPIREDSGQYKYINPLILLDNSSIAYEELDPLKDNAKGYIDEQIKNGRAERISFYFRDLNSSIWTGVYPDDKFVPASLLKVMTVMVYLRAAEDYPNILNQKLFYKKTFDQDQKYLPQLKLTDGYYSVSRLISQAIIQSDNDATYALYKNKEKEHNQLYNALRLPTPPEKLDNFMSPRDVSAIFRALYGSTYLLNYYSEQALELLTFTIFEKGITQGIDQDIKIAHKFGEYAVYYENNVAPTDYQLHDCGIVYYPLKPYFICVMTEGKELKNLEEVIGTISSLTLDFVKNAR